MNRLFKEHLFSEIGAVPCGNGLRDLGVMAEDKRDIYVSCTEHAQRLGRFCLGKAQIHARVRGVQHRRRGRHDRAERGRESG